VRLWSESYTEASVWTVRLSIYKVFEEMGEEKKEVHIVYIEVCSVIYIEIYIYLFIFNWGYSSIVW
jgi:hypothetical protein